MQPIPLIRKVVLAPAISYLAGEGVPVDRYLRLANYRLLPQKRWIRSYRFNSCATFWT
jgi:hypothetical protein